MADQLFKSAFRVLMCASVGWSVRFGHYDLAATLSLLTLVQALDWPKITKGDSNG